MQAAHQQFKANLGRVRDMGAVRAHVAGVTSGALDLSDLLRAQIVLAVSAFDSLIHELVRIGMIEAAGGQRPMTDAMRKYQVSVGSALAAKGSTGLGWLEAEVRSRNGFLAFQQPEKVADAIRLVTSVPLWPEVATALGAAPADLKKELQVIVDRRNKIAHEADADPTFPGRRWPITPGQVNDAVDFLERLGDAIYKVTK